VVIERNLQFRQRAGNTINPDPGNQQRVRFGIDRLHFVKFSNNYVEGVQNTTETSGQFTITVAGDHVYILNNTIKVLGDNAGVGKGLSYAVGETSSLALMNNLVLKDATVTGQLRGVDSDGAVAGDFETDTLQRRAVAGNAWPAGTRFDYLGNNVFLAFSDWQSSVAGGEGSPPASGRDFDRNVPINAQLVPTGAGGTSAVIG
jgi:hypothetical protein